MAGVNGNFNFNHNFFVGIKKGEKTGRPEKEDRIDKRPEEKTEEKRPQVDVRPQVSASDVLSFMQNSSVIMSGITAAKQINPAFAIILEGTTCSDVPGTDEFGFSTHIGEGAALSIRDGGCYSDVDLTLDIMNFAIENKIKCQYKQTTLGGNDASAVQISNNGIKVAALSVPCRYIHSQSNVAKLSDVKSMEDILIKYLESKVNNDD